MKKKRVDKVAPKYPVEPMRQRISGTVVLGVLMITPSSAAADSLATMFD